jgi:glycerophosphoryl diester phosphodiesterase
LILNLFALLGLAGLASAQAPADGAGLHRIDPRTPQGLMELFQPSVTPLPFVSAHRGGAQPGFPENCVPTFEHTLKHTFAILEIDPRYTKDRQIVVHHDATLDRTTTGKGKVADFTLAELKPLRLKDNDGQVTEFAMPTLDELFDWARGKTVLVLDQKDVPAVERVRQITQHKAEAFAMVIVSSFADVKACHAENPNVMMEVMIPNREKAEQFDKLGVPWRNVVAFVGHQPPEDRSLYEYIHGKGVSCMIGTSRNLDRQLLTRQIADLKPLEPEYRAFLGRGADVIETDIPVQLGTLLHSTTAIPASKQRFLHAPTAH